MSIIKWWFIIENMKIKIFLTLLVFLGVLFFPLQILAQNYKLELNFFYSETCPHCIAEQKFLDGLETKYPEIKINRYLITDPTDQQLLKDLLKKHNAERYFGAVPMNFVGEDFIPGFDNAEGIGKKIETSIKKQLEGGGETKPDNKINLPLVGKIDLSKYSLPALTVVLGILDGFNVCSLGALVLILGLVLALRSRKKIMIFGGLFILTTAVVYGLLILLWHQLFSFFAAYEKAMKILIGFLGIGGGIYFLKEFRKFKKYGPNCEVSTKRSIVSKLSSKIESIFKKEKHENIAPLIIGVLLFAIVLTIVEFPCSAAVPVIFAGILAKAQLSVFLYVLYIIIYLVFYMLDEIIVFLIAVLTLKLWLASPKFVTWITLIEAIILFLLGLYYLL